MIYTNIESLCYTPKKTYVNYTSIKKLNIHISKQSRFNKKNINILTLIGYLNY